MKKTAEQRTGRAAREATERGLLQQQTGKKPPRKLDFKWENQNVSLGKAYRRSKVESSSGKWQRIGRNWFIQGSLGWNPEEWVGLFFPTGEGTVKTSEERGHGTVKPLLGSLFPEGRKPGTELNDCWWETESDLLQHCIWL